MKHENQSGGITDPLVAILVTKGECLVFNNSEWTYRAGLGVLFEHPSESATVS